MTPRRRLTALVVLLAVVLVVAVLLAGGAHTPRSAALSPSRQAAALAGSPAELAALHSQSDQLLGGGPHALTSRLKALRGYPVVINEWASWCGPCQAEFPAYQRASVAYGKRVAFIGLDSADTDASAAAFLRRFPVSYPSYTDPDKAIAQKLEAVEGVPETLYFDRAGHEVYNHAGSYVNAAALEQDIRRYLLG